MAAVSATEARSWWFELIDKLVSSHASILITHRGSGAALVPAEVRVSRGGACPCRSPLSANRSPQIETPDRPLARGKQRELSGMREVVVESPQMAFGVAGA
jgi:hypothetical protein